MLQFGIDELTDSNSGVDRQRLVRLTEKGTETVAVSRITNSRAYCVQCARAQQA